MLNTLFHLIALLQFGYACYYDYVYVNVPGAPKYYNNFGGKMKYLTYCNAVVITIYYGIALLNDLIGDNKPTSTRKPVVRRVKDLMFCSLSFPLSVFVGSTFWGIYAIDRELILPRALDPVFPLWLNHVLHTNIVVFNFLELVTSFRMYPSRKTGLSILFTFMAFYLVWLHTIYFYTGRWVYPILKFLNWPLKIAFYLLSLGIVYGSYSLGEYLNECIWPKEVEKVIRAAKKKSK